MSLAFEPETFREISAADPDTPAGHAALLKLVDCCQRWLGNDDHGDEIITRYMLFLVVAVRARRQALLRAIALRAARRQAALCALLAKARRRDDDEPRPRALIDQLAPAWSPHGP